MEYINQFLSNLKDDNIKQERIELPLIFSNLAYFYSYNSFLYIVPKDSLTDFTKLIEIKNFLSNEKKYSRIYIYVPFEYRRFEKLFIESKISFMDRWGNEYYYNTKEKSYSFFDSDKSLKFLKSTQLVFKYFILKNKNKSTVREISKATKLSLSTISIALYSLSELNVLEKVGSNTSTSYELKNKKEAFNILEKLFINPVKEKKYLMCSKKYIEELKQVFAISGEAALEKYTNLTSAHNTTQIAISLSNNNNMDDRLTDEENDVLIEIQNFIYDPLLFSYDHIIDKFDAYLNLLFIKNKDSREKEAFNQLKKELIYGAQQNY